MDKQIKIIISGPMMTGKTVLAGKIARFLAEEGYTDVETKWGDPNRVIEMDEPFASVPIRIFETNIEIDTKRMD
jgi:tRNA uridine 5-carbamoylmethylation protein Kti12